MRLQNSDYLWVQPKRRNDSTSYSDSPAWSPSMLNNTLSWYQLMTMNWPHCLCGEGLNPVLENGIVHF